jgi:hypothetical protein
MGTWLTDSELLAHAARAGVHASRHQIERWRKHGLLPRSVQHHVPGRRGSLSLCPPESVSCLVALCRLHQKERRLDELRFLLWWEGYAVDRKKLRGYIVRTVQRATEAIHTALAAARRDAAAKEREPEALTLAVAEQIARALSSGNSRSPLVRFVRRNLRRDRADLHSALVALLQTILGSAPAFGSDGLDDAPLESTVFRAAGLEDAARPGPGGTPPLVPEGADSIPGVFKKMTVWDVFNVAGWPRIVETASDDDLDRARDLAHLFAEEFPALLDAYGLLFGKNFMGLGMIRYLRGIPRPLLLPLFLILQRHVGAKAFDPIRSAVRTRRPQAEAFIAIVKMFPQYKEYFTPDMAQKLARLPARTRARIIKEVGGYLKTHHPEVMGTGKRM